MCHIENGTTCTMPKSDYCCCEETDCIYCHGEGCPGCGWSGRRACPIHDPGSWLHHNRKEAKPMKTFETVAGICMVIVGLPAIGLGIMRAVQILLEEMERRKY